MTSFQKALERVCTELRLTVVIPFTVTVQDGIVIEAEALLPKLGATHGMIIVTSFDDLKGMAKTLVEKGYGYSVLSQLTFEDVTDLQSYIDMFAEWGWAAADEPKPEWMT